MSRRKKIAAFTILFLVFFSFLVSYSVIDLTAVMGQKGTEIEEFIGTNITSYFDPVAVIAEKKDSAIATLSLIALAYIVLLLVEFIVGIITKTGKRSKTIVLLLSNIIKYVIVFIIIFQILIAWGVESSTLLGAFALIGIAVGLASQSLLTDIIAGLFNVFEGQFSVGDIIEIDGFRGRVIEIGVRSMRAQSWQGDILIVRNGSYDSLVNYSKALSTAICDISIAYEQDVERAEAVIKAITPALKEKYKSIKAGPFYLGVETLGSSDVVLRVIAKVRERDRLQVERDLNRELKVSFDKNNVTIPFPQMVIHKAELQKKGRDKAINPNLIPDKTDKLVETEGESKSKHINMVETRDPDALSKFADNIHVNPSPYDIRDLSKAFSDDEVKSDMKKRYDNLDKEILEDKKIKK